MAPSLQSRILVRALSALAAALLAACGGGAQGDQVADRTADATRTAEDTAEDTAEPLATNLTDGCVEGAAEAADYFPDKVAFDEASGVSVSYHGNYKVTEVLPVAEGADPLRYVLVQCGTPAPSLDGDLAGAQVVDVPVSSLVTLTTTNLPHLDLLDAVDRLAGVGTGAFVATPSVLARIEAGEVPDFANDLGEPDLERLVETSPDLLVVDGFGDAILDEVGRFTDAGIATVINVDFNERTLLGRAEWLKFTALFLNAEAAADAAFADIAASYRDVAQAAAAADERPTVFANMPYEGTWFMPGGRSFFATALEDAGGDYVFSDDESAYSIQLDIETVLERAGDADIWLQAGSVKGTLDDLAAQDPRFAEFAAFREGQVWANDVNLTPGGGYPVFETAYTRADLFLADLVKILHPALLPDHELVYFGQVPQG